jgi:dGTPase
MFKSVYTNPVAKGQEAKAEQMVKELYQYYMEHVELLPQEFRVMIKEKNEAIERVVCDYVAGMTDRFALSIYQELFVPKRWTQQIPKTVFTRRTNCQQKNFR